MRFGAGWRHHGSTTLSPLIASWLACTRNELSLTMQINAARQFSEIDVP